VEEDTPYVEEDTLYVNACVGECTDMWRRIHYMWRRIHFMSMPVSANACMHLSAWSLKGV
jgi:hypothetical protein